MDNVVDQLFRSAYHLQHSNSIQDYGHPQQHPQHPHHQQHLYPQHPQQTQSSQIGGPIQLQQLGQQQHDVYGRPFHPQQHDYRAHPQYPPPPSHAPTHHQHQHVHPHPHAPHVPRPPSRTGSPPGMDDLDVGTPGDESYLVAHHPHPTHQQQQQMHMQQQHMRARELELENVGASGSAMAGSSTQTVYDPPSASSASASALNPTAALPMDQSFDEEPLYVNAKQYYRILKRRMARQRLDELHRLSRQRKPYLHESRHKHAMRRPRGPGGRFLTAEEIAAQKASQTHQDGGESDTSQPEGHGENDPAAQENQINNNSSQKTVSERSAIGPKRVLQPQPTSQTHAQNEVQNGNLAPNLMSLSIPNEEHDVKPLQQSRTGMFIPQTFSVDTNPDGSVTLREPYSPQQPSTSGQSPTSFFGQDRTESDVQAGSSPQLHHVPHPHSHHSHVHQRRRTHMHSQMPRNEAGGLYTPFDIPVPVEISLLSPDQSSNGDALAGMSGSQMGMNGMGMIGLNGNQPTPGEVRVTPGMPLTGSAQADLQRRTDEILAFSARSMGSAGTGESGR